MPVTEVATFQLKTGSNITDLNSQAGRIWQSICRTVSRADNFEGLFYGHEVETPNVAQLFVNWDSLESHKKFMTSPEYGPMVESLEAIISGPPSFVHYDFASMGKLVAALSAPVTELATFYLPSKTSSFQTNLERFEKASSESGTNGFLGITTGWSIEDVEHEGFSEGKTGKSVLLAIGWDSIDAHMAFRETDVFKDIIGLLRGEPKGVELHHATLRTA
ncbi:hypothetical protein BDV97DRAFT_397317 [Delphinella strobiligena]|nr:hypothetical protein BDV97DRAFT_397317 [Delphinella strobiligena]